MAGNANSGRKSLEEEIRVTKEKIKQEALVELANRVMFKRLTALETSENIGQEKDFALPIALKGMTDKKDVTSGGLPLPLLGGQSNVSSNPSNEEAIETEKKD